MSHPVPSDAEAVGYLPGPASIAGRDHTRAADQRLSQQAVDRGVLTPETLTIPGRICDVVTELSPYLTVDDSLTAGQLAGMGRTMTDIRSGDIDVFTLPAHGVGRARRQSVGWPDVQAIEATGSALGRDEMASYQTGQ